MACEDVVAYEADSINPSKYEDVNEYDDVKANEADSIKPSIYEAVTAC